VHCLDAASGKTIWEKLASEGPRAEDVERSKRLLVGSTRIGLQGNAAQVDDLVRGHFVAGDLAATEKLLARVPQLTVAELRAVAKRTFGTEVWAAGTLRGRVNAAPAAAGSGGE
jgi:predicted Zn-dependent peptidase